MTVDYILFLTADVTVTPNLNEIRDYKYVDKTELQAMFEDPSTSKSSVNPYEYILNAVQNIHSLLGSNLSHEIFSLGGGTS